MENTNHSENSSCSLENNYVKIISFATIVILTACLGWCIASKYDSSVAGLITGGVIGVIFASFLHSAKLRDMTKKLTNKITKKNN